jgi:hypothetical protein
LIAVQQRAEEKLPGRHADLYTERAEGLFSIKQEPAFARFLADPHCLAAASIDVDA